MYCDFERFDSYSLVAKVFSFCYLRLLPVSERVPEVYVLVESRWYELVLCGVRRQGPNLVHVTRHDLLKVEVESALKDGIPGCSQHQLAALALKYAWCWKHSYYVLYDKGEN